MTGGEGPLGGGADGRSSGAVIYNKIGVRHFSSGSSAELTSVNGNPITCIGSFWTFFETSAAEWSFDACYRSSSGPAIAIRTQTLIETSLIKVR